MARNSGLARPQRRAARRMAPAEQGVTVQAFARMAWRKRKGTHGRAPREQSRMLHAFVGRAQLQPTVERRRAPSEQPEWVRVFARTAWRKRTGARRMAPVERWGEPRWSTDKWRKHPAREPRRVSLQDDCPQKTGAGAPQSQSRERRCVTFRMQRKRPKTRETRARTHLCRLAALVRRWTVSR